MHIYCCPAAGTGHFSARCVGVPCQCWKEGFPCARILTVVPVWAEWLCSSGSPLVPFGSCPPSLPPLLFREPKLELVCTIPDRYSQKSCCGTYSSCLGARASLGRWNEHACCCNTSCVAVVSVLTLLLSLLTNAVGMRQAKVSGFLFKFSLFLILWIKEAKKKQNILGFKIGWCYTDGAFSKMTHGLLGFPESPVRGSSFSEQVLCSYNLCASKIHSGEKRNH